MTGAPALLREATELLSEADLVQDEAVLISLTERGYVKRVAASAFRSQSRGGRGVMGHTTKDEDVVVALIPARSLDTMLFFSDRGKVYREKVYQIPDADRSAKGVPLVNVLALDAKRTCHCRDCGFGFLRTWILHPRNGTRQGQSA